MTEPVRETARGQADDTPAKALGGVTLVVGVAVALVLIVCMILWLALK